MILSFHLTNRIGRFIVNNLTDYSVQAFWGSRHTEAIASRLARDNRRVESRPATGGIMTLACPVDLDSVRLRREVQDMYSRVAMAPDGSFHFHRGPEYARTWLGYDAAELSALPPEVTQAFAGVGNPHAVAPLRPGARIVDIGSGAGTDLLLAARHVGPSGRASGVDMTADMRERARAGAHQCGLTNVDVLEGDATTLPLDDASVDVVISNGVLNLVPEKERAFAEIARVLRPGGRLQIADIVTGMELSEAIRRDIDLWTG
jgi:arsenite methyltransferase